ncbi:hypothetical protein PI125_g19273 [Phytophthora idaei]|nr:hypothetical protein PI125_g19273 [Phytophthora idaei]
MMSSEEYEVLYTVCSELAKKGISPGVFGAPGQFGPGACGGPGPWGLDPGALVPVLGHLVALDTFVLVDVVVVLWAGCAC